MSHIWTCFAAFMLLLAVPAYPQSMTTTVKLTDQLPWLSVIFLLGIFCIALLIRLLQLQRKLKELSSISSPFGKNELRRTQDRYSIQGKNTALFHSLPNPTFLWQAKQNDFVLMEYNYAAVVFTAGFIRQQAILAKSFFNNQPDILHDLKECSNTKKPQSRELSYQNHWTGFTAFLRIKYVFIDPDLVLMTADDISEHRRLEESLKESETKFRIVAENNANWEFWMDPDFKPIYNSPVCETVTGYASEDFIQNPELLEQIIVEEDRAFYIEHKSIAKDVKEPHKFQFRLIRKDGALRWIEHHCVPVYDDSGRYLGKRGNNRDITQEKIYENQILLEKETARTYLDIAGSIIVVLDSTHKILMINKKGCEITGFTESELLSRDWFEVFIPERNKKEALSAFNLSIKGTVSSSQSYENHIVTRGGQERLINWHNSFLKDNKGVVSSVLLSGEDITERKYLEKLREHFFEVSLDLICIATLDGFFHELSPTWMHTLGWSLSELKSRPYIEFVHPDDLQRTIDATKQLSQGNNVLNFDNRYLCKDGSYRWLSWKSFVDSEQNLIYAIARDITDRKHTEDLLIQAKKDAEEAGNMKSAFLANMSHEIRTPLNAIAGYTHLAIQNCSETKVMDYLTKIQFSTRNLLTIINDILDLSRIEAGKLELESIPFSIEELVHNVRDMIRLKAEEKGLHLEFIMDSRLPSTIKGDPLRLNQVLLNLLSNAIKFTEKGKVLVSIQLHEKHKDSVKIHFSVKDTGIGISKEQQNRLFQAFSQADGSITRKYGGSGLGLVISSKLVEMMGSHIELESIPGVGSNFFFTIKLELDAHKPKDNALPHELLKTWIYVLVRNKAALKTIKEYFHWITDHLLFADTGLKLLRLLEDDLSSSIDTMKYTFLYYEANDSEPTDTLQMIKSHHHLAAFPVYIIADHETTSDEIKLLMNAGANSILHTPLSKEKLLDIISSTRMSRNIPSKTVSHPAPTNTEIMIVEDNPINMDIAREILQDKGFKVIPAKSGRESISLLCGNKAVKPSLVLMDIQMPGLDGYKTAEKLRRLGYKQPIIAMTAHAFQEEIEKCYQSGMNDHITKPYEPDNLLDIIYKWIKNDLNEKQSPVKSDTQGLKLFNQNKYPGIDVEKYLERLKGNKELHYRIYRLFIAEYSDFIQKFRNNINNADHKANLGLIHDLKGASGTIMAMEIYSICIRIEQKLKIDPLSSIDELIQELEKKLLIVLSSISHYLEDA